MIVTDEMVHTAQRTLIRYAVAEDAEIKPGDVTDEAIDERLAELREDEAAVREDAPDLPSLDEIFAEVLTAALNAAEATT